MDTKDRIKGAFIGLYFGSGVNPRLSSETSPIAPLISAEEAQKRFGDKNFDEIPRDYKLYDQHRGTKIIYDILIKYGKITPEIYKKYLMDLHNKYDVFKEDIHGPSTKRAVKAILAGGDINKIGRKGITCGSAMMTLPVGMMFYNDLEKLVENTVGACIISHNTDIAIETAIATNVTLANLISGMEKFDAIYEGIKRAKKLYGKFGEKTSEPKAYERIQNAVESLKRKTMEEAVSLIPEKVGVSWFARETIPGAFANYTVVDNPYDSSLLAMKCGGDNQTVPEIACAFLGAEKGPKIFPKEILNKIEKVNNIKIYEMVKKLIDKIVILEEKGK